MSQFGKRHIVIVSTGLVLVAAGWVAVSKWQGNQKREPDTLADEKITVEVIAAYPLTKYWEIEIGTSRQAVRSLKGEPVEGGAADPVWTYEKGEDSYQIYFDDAGNAETIFGLGASLEPLPEAHVGMSLAELQKVFGSEYRVSSSKDNTEQMLHFDSRGFLLQLQDDKVVGMGVFRGEGLEFDQDSSEESPG